MPDGPALTYIYDGTLEGFYTAVFEAYARKKPVKAITANPEIQTGLGEEAAEIETDGEKALRVEKGIRQKVGDYCLGMIWRGFWSGDDKKDTVIYRYIRAAMGQGRKVYNNLSHPDVLAMEYLLKNIGWEEGRVRGFVRFSKMENGVYYAKIEPRNNLVPLFMPLFADRYNDMPFVIHDPGHKMAGVYDTTGWRLIEGADLTPPEKAEGEDSFIRMWRLFCKTVAVEGRISAKRQRGFMPKHYWKNLPEMMPFYDIKEYSGEDKDEKGLNGIQGAHGYLKIPE
ncbi:MAG: TIGR03915 family putative DNA repair protein [Oscillospiraceae bacterium]|jgi:probable DNA metabolism protein|nr:TIGR03915 family putative DNA repair protein [Oscillospiraceae bacterium]